MKDYDPRMHSAEHILNQTMDRMFGCGRSFSAHIERKKSKCDYRFERNLTEGETREIERRVNDIIGRNLAVREEWMPREQAARQYNLDKLPEATGDTLRIIRIGDYDSCPCIGAHVQSTSEIGSFIITSTEYHEGVLRLRFKTI